MKFFYPAFLILLFSGNALAQAPDLQTLFRKADDPKEDTTKVLALNALADYYGFNQFDSSIYYAQLTLNLSEKINYSYGRFLGLRSLFFAYNCQAIIPEHLKLPCRTMK